MTDVTRKTLTSKTQLLKRRYDKFSQRNRPSVDTFYRLVLEGAGFYGHSPIVETP
jgi:hypothetical protein